MLFDFLLSEYALGFSKGQVRVLDPTRLCDDPRGLSGTEVTALGLAHELARQGHRVHVYTHLRYPGFCGNPGHLFYCDIGSGQRTGPGMGAHTPTNVDVAVAFHDSAPLWHWQAKKRVVWHQTIHPLHSETMAIDPVDLYISSTARNAADLACKAPGTTWAVVPNGWDFGTYQPHTPVPGRLFYHTSPERGLHILLRALPLIRQRVANAHLDVWCRMETAQGHHPAIWEEIQRGLIECKDYLTVHPEGGSRNEVLAALAQASVLAYPSEPPMPCEVMPVSVMEACATGVPVVTAPSDGFEEAFGFGWDIDNALAIVASPPSKNLQEFVDAVVELLDMPEFAKACTKDGRYWAKKHTFAATAKHFLEVVSG